MILSVKLPNQHNLTRRDVAEILKGIQKSTFDQFKNNPEEFLIKASNLIDEQKATVIVEHIAYNVLENSYDTGIFTEPSLKKGTIGKNAIPATKSLTIISSLNPIQKENLRQRLTKIKRLLYMSNCRVDSISIHRWENIIQTGQSRSMKDR